jgi:predicted porin
MFGGVSKAGWATILAGSVLLGGSISAQAADLGGDCCADLEERVAELEATTARKGNRKVSLKISGWVNEAVFFWDDGREQNVYVGTNSLEQDRFKFAGDAKINAEWSAGYTIEIGINGAASNGFDQTGPGSSNSLSIRKSYWYLKSNKLGSVAVGQNGTATYHVLDDADGTNTRNYADAQAAEVAVNNFFTLTNGIQNSLRWKDVLRGFDNGTPGQSGRRNVVRYDSPSFQGFSIAAAWGEDDLWDAALTYQGEIGAFKLLGKVGYGESTDPVATKCGDVNDTKCQWFGTAGTIMHAPTGLYVYGGYGWQKLENPTLAVGADDTSTTWFVQSGIEKQWMPLGKTTVFGEFRHDDAGANPGKTFGASVDFWAGGVVQNIDAAAMDLYVIYRHAEGDFNDTATTTVNLDNFDMVMTGARIQF